jgi:2'-5' RNA ligase
MPSIRTFIAFDTPRPIREKISELQTELKKTDADVRWEPIEKFHATIKFLGDVNEAILPAVLTKIQSVVESHTSFEVVYTTLGCFPHRKNPRVLWVGCENTDGTLELLKTRLDVELLSFGFEAEQRQFHPHITLGRIKSSKGLKNLTPMLENLTFQPQIALIKEILTMKSLLKHDGSEYSIVKRMQLQIPQ